MKRQTLGLWGIITAMMLVLVAMEGRAEAQDQCPGGYMWDSSLGGCRKICGAGFTFSYTTGDCVRQMPQQATCPPGYWYNYPQRRCVRHLQCPAGWYYSYSLYRCVRLPQSCPYGYYYNYWRRTCVRRCPLGWSWTGVRCTPPATRCPAGWRWSAYYGRCIHWQHCSPGYSWNGYHCVYWRRCPPGYYYSPYYRQCRPQISNCPDGYRYRPGWGCVLICPQGWYYANGQCFRVHQTCPPDYFYSYTHRRCIRKCAPGYYWNYREQRCTRLYW